MDIEIAHAYGYSLMAFGVIVGAFFWFIIGNVPLTALGIGLVVIGSSIAITPLSPVPSATVRKLLESSMLNIEALLEELDVSGKGFYVPKEDGAVQVYVPLDVGKNLPPPANAKVEGLVAKVDGRSYLLIFPPGSFLMKNTIVEGDMEDLLSENIVDTAGLADSIKAIDDGPTITIEVSSPKSKMAAGRVRNVMGSLEASIAATIVATSRKRTVRIESEEVTGNRKKITLVLV